MQPCANCQRNVADALSAKRASRDLEGKLSAASQKEKALAVKVAELDKVRASLAIVKPSLIASTQSLLPRRAVVDDLNLGAWLHQESL